MRIAIDTRELLDRPTGVGRYLAELLARWTRDASLARHELVLLSPRRPPARRPWIGAGGAAARDIEVPGGSGSRWEQTALASAANLQRPDVFFAPGYTVPLRVRCPVVVAVHDVSFAAHPEWFRWREGLRRRLLTRWSARKARRVITLSAFSRDEIVRHLGVAPEKIAVTPLAVDSHPALQEATARASDAARDEVAEAGSSRMVLYVGSILERRHLPELVAAFARVAPRVPAATLEIVGDNRTHPRINLNALASALGAGHRVRVRDYVDDATLAALYGRARAFAFLSEYEGFGLPPLEAMQAGVPAIVLDTPVSREVYGDAALRIDLASPSSLDEALVSLLEDDAIRRRQLEASALLRSRYTWDTTARQTMDILQEAAH